MSTFCRDHSISRKTFYALLGRAREEGPAAVLEPRSRRPHTSPTRTGKDVQAEALKVRAALELSGLDHGPISVFDKMARMGLEPPAVATLARIFRDLGVSRNEPNKRPRSSYRRFVYPAPNALWQLDATEYVLAGGRKCVVFQLLDDHSRVAVASLVAGAETSTAAVQVMDKGIAARGVPQRLLTDNGSALNQTRRGQRGQLVIHVTALGIEAITGKPYKPTTQGKNERFHQTLFRWLDKQPMARTIAELQDQVDAFDQIYNTQRPHQSLPGRITPQESWDATPVAQPPQPPLAPTKIIIPGSQRPRTGLPDKPKVLKIRGGGSVRVGKTVFQIGSPYAGQFVRVITDEETISFIQTETGEVLIEHPLPEPGTRYVSNRKPYHRPR